MTDVAIIGGGSIGVAFAIVFARAGHGVHVQDPDEKRRSDCPTEIAARLHQLDEFGLLDETPAAIIERIGIIPEISEAVRGAALVQECAPEDQSLKQQLFAELDRLAPPHAILASSSSAMPISRIAAELPGRARCLVAHPANPPYLLSVVEIVPAPFTSHDTLERTRTFLEGCGLSPVQVGEEIEGFIFNRLQGALLREAYCLVRDGIADVADIDRLVTHALGLRWSVAGPFETADLNTRGGIASHAQKMGPAYARMGAERGQNDPWTPDLVAEVTAQRRRALPMEEWDARVEWRDRMLMSLIEHRRRCLKDMA
ncbi:3-hydroxyacyl-CoA dehydrogenase [Fodinicurvata halophila]|uniref:3-hydroxyacyl-CoA dehydrogenase n=1 Tax=Fodinicurvata halophila TaxID=1419723 RepID=A0ABV8UKW9_9PROT